jgi:hypothetical protein
MMNLIKKEEPRDVPFTSNTSSPMPHNPQADFSRNSSMLFMQNRIRQLEDENTVLRGELTDLQANTERNLKETKLKQWCCRCLQPAIYYCCWTGSYCSIDCQNQDWHTGHKSVCRRKALNKAANSSQSSGADRANASVTAPVGGESEGGK